MKPAGRTKYGKKKIRENKKLKIELIDKIREDILNIKDQLEKNQNLPYRQSHVKNEIFMKKYGASYGDVDRCLMLLEREGLIGKENGQMKWRSVAYDKSLIEEPVKKQIELWFKVEECPICSSRLEEVVSKAWSHTIYHKKCHHGCFMQNYDECDESIQIYDKIFRHDSNTHKSISGTTKREVLKKIEFWKTKHRYIARNLLGSWED